MTHSTRAVLVVALGGKIFSTPTRYRVKYLVKLRVKVIDACWLAYGIERLENFMIMVLEVLRKILPGR